MNLSLDRLRYEYHSRLFERLISFRNNSDIPNIADKSSRVSIEISKNLLGQIGFAVTANPIPPQAVGQQFAEVTKEFLDESFSLLNHLRPGDWHFSTSQANSGIAAFDQYEHLAQLQRIISDYPDIKTALGGDYLITPDIIVARNPESDSYINKDTAIVSDKSAQASPLRQNITPQPKPLLHASISCKWTMRSDRAQNTRTESLNLIRNRKGNTPHIVAVTFEPLPGRLASIAMGTGDLDCTYHVALYELREAIVACDRTDSLEILDDLIIGRRLRDISDLPFDLAI